MVKRVCPVAGLFPLIQCQKLKYKQVFSVFHKTRRGSSFAGGERCLKILGLEVMMI
jgi:hypothetical protein